MVSVCLPSCNNYHLTWVSLTLGCGISPPLLLTLEEGYLLTTALPDLQRGIASLSPPAPTKPLLLGGGIAPPSCSPWPRAWGSSSRLLPLISDLGSSSRPFLHHCSLALLAPAPDLRRGVALLGRCPSGMGSSRLLPLTLDMG